MKKIMSMLMVAVLAIAMVSCGGNPEKKGKDAEKEAAQDCATEIEQLLEIQDAIEAAGAEGDYSEVQRLSSEMQKLLTNPEVLEAYQEIIMERAQSALDVIEGQSAEAYEEAYDEYEEAYDDAVEAYEDAYEDAVGAYDDAVEAAAEAYEEAYNEAASAYEDLSW